MHLTAKQDLKTLSLYEDAVLRELPHMRAAFSDHVVVELPGAKHFIQEDAPDEIAGAIAERFG